MKTKELFMKEQCYILNEAIKHPLFELKFDIGGVFDSFKNF